MQNFQQGQGGGPQQNGFGYNQSFNNSNNAPGGGMGVGGGPGGGGGGLSNSSSTSRLSSLMGNTSSFDFGQHLFMNLVNIADIYTGKGEFTDLEAERGIFIVSILRTILMQMIYADKYGIIDKSMSDSNIGARKKKNIRIFVVNSVLHDVLSSSTTDPIDIMVLDFKQMFDSECLYECPYDVYKAGVDDDYFPLQHEANRETYVAAQTPSGISKRETSNEGDL